MNLPLQFYGNMVVYAIATLMMVFLNVLLSTVVVLLAVQYVGCRLNTAVMNGWGRKFFIDLVLHLMMLSSTYLA